MKKAKNRSHFKATKNDDRRYREQQVLNPLTEAHDILIMLHVNSFNKIMKWE